MFEKGRLTGVLACLAVLAACSGTEPCGSKMDGGYPVSLDAGVRLLRTKIRETEDSREGLKCSWEDQDRIAVLYGDAGRVDLYNSASNPGHFTGEVSTPAQAAAFAASRHCAVNALSDYIQVTLDGDRLAAHVDLTGQDGTVGSVQQHELVAASAPAGSPLRFAHKLCVVRLDIVSDLFAEGISQVEMSFRPDEGSDALFAREVTFKTGLDGEERMEVGDAAFCTLVPVTPLSGEAGTAKIYFVVPPRDTLCGELSIAVTDGSGKTYRRYLTLVNRSFRAGDVVARQVKFSPGHAVPSVGDYYYIDGTWGPLAYYADKYPIAVVMSNYTSAADRASGYTHGYAMALRDGAWPAEWGPENVDYPETPDVFEEADATAPLVMMDNLDGLSTCRIVRDLYLTDHGWGAYLAGRVPTVSAIPAAMEYGTDVWVQAYSSTPNTYVFETPAASSGWFLPSTGQWFLAFTGLGGLDPDQLETVTEDGRVKSFTWHFASASAKQDCLDRFCDYFSSWSNPILSRYVDGGRIASTTFYLPWQGQMDWYLWACDEATSEGTGAVVLLTATDVRLGYMPKTTGEGSTNGYTARPVIAF